MASPKNRPSAMTVIAVLWAIGNSVNFARGLYLLAQDIGVFPILTYPLGEYESFRFLVPTEMLLFILLILSAVLGLYAAYGLYTIKSWSYHAALILPTFTAVTYTAFALMYGSIPAEINEILPQAGVSSADLVAFNFLATIVAWGWTIAMWIYLDKQEVKQYFRQAPTPVIIVPPAPFASPVPPPPAPVATTEVRKFCRYCGEGNKTDAVFCERCGRKIG